MNWEKINDAVFISVAVVYFLVSCIALGNIIVTV